MGSKFCNLNICTDSANIVSAAAPQYSSLSCAKGWVTVTSDAFQWGRTQAAAKKLSAELSLPVLSTEYFDDNYVEFALYHDGELVTRHAPAAYEGLPRRRGNAAKLIETLGFNMAEELSLKKVFAVTDCEESVHLLESYLGCPIFGIKAGSPPDGAPDRAEFEAFAGEKTPVQVVVKKSAVRKNNPLYLPNDEGERLCSDDFLASTVFRQVTSPPGVITGFRTPTIFCYTSTSADVVKRLEAWARRFRNYFESEKDVAMPDIRILFLQNGAAIQGYPVVNPDVDAPDISRMFKCLVSVCCVSALGYRGEKHRQLECTFAYAGKLLAYGSRGSASGQTAMPDISIESPWLALSPGSVVEAFEHSAFWDAVNCMGELLGAPLYPFPGDGWQIQRRNEHLTIYER